MNKKIEGNYVHLYAFDEINGADKFYDKILMSHNSFHNYF